jgi:alpha-ribazole phosphatase
MRLLRHLPTSARTGEFNGWRDVDITSDWQMAPYPIDEEMKSAIQSVILNPPEKIFVSPLQRAQKTAARLMELSGIPMTFQIREHLKEMHFGDSEGLVWREIEERYPLESKGWLHNWTAPFPGNGESAFDVANRILKFLDEDAPTSRDLVVCHAGIIKIFLALESNNKKDLLKTIPYNSIHEINLHKVKQNSAELFRHSPF